MSLATSPAQFAYCTDNFAAIPVQVPGTNFTTGGSNTHGAEVTILSALAHDVHFIRLFFGHMNVVGTDTNAVGDLLIDPAGGTSWSVLISDLACGMGSSNGTMPSTSYEFPVWIPAGASVGWRAKTIAVSDFTTGCILIQAYGEPARPSQWWCGQGVETLGVTDSRGTGITSVNGSFGSWTSVGSPSTRLYKAIQLGINGSDGAAASVIYHFEVGYGSQKLPGSSAIWLQLNVSEIGYRVTPGMMTCSVPVGTQMQVRGISNAAPEIVYVGLYGVY